MTKTLGIAPPEMIFGNNAVRVSHESGWAIHFDALDALSLVDKTGESMLRVSYSESWQKMRERVHENIKEVVKPFDWTYTTSYKGTVSATQVWRCGSIGSGRAGCLIWCLGVYAYGFSVHSHG